MSKNTPRSKKDNIVIQEVENELMIYDLSNNEAFCLNETSALIWQLCDGKNSISKISQNLSEKLNNPFDEGLVWLALDQLKKVNLIDNEAPIPHQFEGMSRRQIIKKIGLGSMIALPLVASLVAPTGAMAASCLNLLANCNPAPNQCCPTAMNCVNTPSPSAGQCCSTTGVNTPISGNFPVTGPAATNICGGGAGTGGPFNNPGNPNNVYCNPGCCNGVGILQNCVSAGITPPGNPAGGNDNLTCSCG